MADVKNDRIQNALNTDVSTAGHIVDHAIVARKAREVLRNERVQSAMKSVNEYLAKAR